MINITDIYNTDLKKDIYEKAVLMIKDKNQDLNKIHTYFLPFLWEGGNFNTVRDRYQKMKAEIKNNSSIIRSKARVHESLNIFTLDESFFQAVNNQTKENIKTRAEEQVIFNIDTYLKNMENIRNTIEKKDFAPYKQKEVMKMGKLTTIPIKREDDFILANLSAIYLVMATGRRKDEVFSSLELFKFGKKTFFKGLLKKREEQKEKYNAYILGDYHFLKNCIKVIRAYYPNYDDNNVKSSVNPFIKEVLNDKTITYKSIRDMYVSVAIREIKPDNLADESFKSMILNHSENVNLGTSYDKTRGE